jgi:hypothetical protein
MKHVKNQAQLAIIVDVRSMINETVCYRYYRVAAIVSGEVGLHFGQFLSAPSSALVAASLGWVMAALVVVATPVTIFTPLQGLIIARVGGGKTN